MAIIRLDCNLNGGDSVTPNNELFYRIYGDIDNYAAPIWTTGTALSDSNVTVDNDTVIITGVDGATNASFKIAGVDLAGNEGVLSDEFKISNEELSLTLQDMTKSGTTYTGATDAWDSRGLASQNIIGDGNIGSQIDSITDEEGLIALRDSNTNGTYNDWHTIGIFINTGNYWTIEGNGVDANTAENSSIARALDDKLRVRRSGTQLIAEYYRGATWNTIKDFGSSTILASGTMYMQIFANNIGDRVWNPVKNIT